MGRWNKEQEIAAVRDSIRETVLNDAPKYGNKGVLVPLRMPVATGHYYQPMTPVSITGVYVDYEKPEHDRMVGNDFFWEHYDGLADTVKYARKALEQLRQLKATNGMVQAAVSEQMEKEPPQLSVIIANGWRVVPIDDKTRDRLLAKNSDDVYNNVYNSEGYIEMVNNKGLGPYLFESILQTARTLGNRNIVLPMNDGRAHILFDGSRTNIPNPETAINLHKNGGIEAMTMIAKYVDKDSTLSYPGDGWITRHPVELTFSSKDTAKTFMDEYIHRHDTARNAVIARTQSTQTAFDDYQHLHVSAYLMEFGGSIKETREKVATKLMQYCEADMSDSVEDGWKENTMKELLAMARGEERERGISR